MNWSSSTIYVDVITGEKLSKHEAQTTYLIIKTKKDVKINYREGKGHITYTKLCKRNPQATINFS